MFASNSDWFTALFVSPMIGQSNYNLGVGFAKVNLNFSNSRKTVNTTRRTNETSKQIHENGGKWGKTGEVTIGFSLASYCVRKWRGFLNQPQRVFKQNQGEREPFFFDKNHAIKMLSFKTKRYC